MSPLHFAFYAWFVERLLGGMAPVTSQDLVVPNPELAAGFLQVFEGCVGTMGRDIERTRLALAGGMEDAWFKEKISRINKQLHEQLGKSLGENYKIKNLGPYGKAQYTLSVSTEHIVVE